MEPLRRFKSHVEGRNADVAIYADRIEWALERRIIGRQHSSEMIPMRSISSVTTKRDGVRFTAMRVVTSGNTIDFRVGHAEAKEVAELLKSLILGTHPLQSPETVNQPSEAMAAGSTASVADELSKLAGLRDAGVISDEEFHAQKSRLLGA